MADTDVSSLTQSIINLASVLSEQLSQFSRNITGATSALSGIISVGDTFNPMQAANTVMQTAGRYVPPVGPMWQAYSTAGEQANQLGMYGIGNTDVTGIARRATSLGTTTERLIELLTRYPQATGGIAPTAEARAQTLEEVHRKAMENKVAQDLLNSNRLYNETLLEAISYQASLHPELTKSTEGLKALADKAVASTAAMDQNARVTGQNVEQISAETRERMNDIKLQLSLRHMTEEQRTQMTRLLESTQGLGKPIQDLMQKLAVGARLDDADRRLLSYLDSSGANLAGTVREMRDAQTAEAKQRAAENLELSKIRITEAMSTKEFSNILQTVKGPMAAEYAAAAAANKELMPILAQQKLMGPGTTVAQARAETQRVTGLAQAGYTPTGEVDVRQLIGREYNQTMLTFKNSLAATMALFDQHAINNIDAYVSKLRTFNEVIGAGLTSQQKEEKMVEFFNKLMSDLDKIAHHITGTPVPTTPSTTTPSTTTPSIPSGTVPSPSQQLGPPPSGSNVQTFNEGTKEVKGKWFWPFAEEGELAILHGNEAVVPIDQLHNFIEEASKTLYGSKTNAVSSPTSDLIKISEEPVNKLTKIITGQVEQVAIGLSQIIPKVGEMTAKEFKEASAKKEKIKPVDTSVRTPPGAYDGIRDFGLNQPVEPRPVAPKPSDTSVRTPSGAYDGIRDFGLNRPVAVEISDTARPSTSPIARPIRPGERINSNDAFAAMMFGGASRARTDEEDAKYKEWIMGGQVGPDPTRQITKVPKHISDLAVLAPKMGIDGPRKQDVGVRVLESRPKSDSEYALVQEAVRKQEEKDAASKALKTKKESAYQSKITARIKPSESKTVSPEIQKILEEGESGKAYALSSETAEKEFARMQKQQLGKIKTPEPGRLPSMSDIASKMTEGAEPVKRGLDAAASVIPKVAEMGMPGSLGDMVGMLKTLNGTMSSVARSSKAMEGYNRTTAKQAKKKSGSLV